MTEMEQLLHDALVELLIAARGIEQLGHQSRIEDFNAYIKAQSDAENAISILEEDLYVASPVKTTTIQ